MNAPDRTLEQRRQALARANTIRSQRAQLKRDLKAGKAWVVDVLLEPDDWADTMKVFDLLIAVPKIGRVKVNKTLVAARISPSKTVGGLSPRQRRELVGLLGKRAHRADVTEITPPTTRREAA